jgi:hypothetical protein
MQAFPSPRALAMGETATRSRGTDLLQATLRRAVREVRTKTSGHGALNVKEDHHFLSVSSFNFMLETDCVKIQVNSATSYL